MARDERHAKDYDGLARRWLVERIERVRGAREHRVKLAVKLPGSEICLTPGDYALYAFDDKGHAIDCERFEVAARGMLLHCGKNLRSVESVGDPRREERSSSETT